MTLETELFKATCKTKNGLYCKGEDEVDRLLVPEMKYTLLRLELRETYRLVLDPADDATEPAITPRKRS
jgi:hypothetical protein